VSQWHPPLWENTTPLEAPRTPEEGYHLEADMAGRTIAWIDREKSLHPDKPWIAYYAPNGHKPPVGVPSEWIEKYRGKFDDGYDQLRDRILARQKELGIVPADTTLAPWPDVLPSWDDLTDLDNKVGALLRSTIQEPAVLVCEDVHWADQPSVDLLAPLLPIIHELPMFLLLLARPDRDAPGWRLVGAARDEFGDALVELRLIGLPEDQSRELVSNLLVIESLPSSTREYILARSEGDPLFVEEVIRMLIDRGVIHRDDERWVATEGVLDVDIPETIHGLLLARIDRLPTEIRRTLRVASVIGRRFPATVLGDVVSRS
jgi:Sulfatase